MTLNTMQPHRDTTRAKGLADRFQEAREATRQLDDALHSLGSPRKPEKRLDRAATPPPTTPVFNPTKLSY